MLLLTGEVIRESKEQKTQKIEIKRMEEKRKRITEKNSENTKKKIQR